MKTLHFHIPNSLPKLHDELREAIPTLEVTIVHPEFGKMETPESMVLTGKDDDVWLRVSDDSDEVTIQAVIDAHDESVITDVEVTMARKEVLEAKLTDDSIEFVEMKELMRLRG